MAELEIAYSVECFGRRNERFSSLAVELRHCQARSSASSRGDDLKASQIYRVVSMGSLKVSQSLIKIQHNSPRRPFLSKIYYLSHPKSYTGKFFAAVKNFKATSTQIAGFAPRTTYLSFIDSAKLAPILSSRSESIMNHIGSS